MSGSWHSLQSVIGAAATIREDKNKKQKTKIKTGFFSVLKLLLPLLKQEFGHEPG